MKQQETFNKVFNAVRTFVFAGTAVFLLVLLLIQHVSAATYDPKFFFLEKPAVSVSVVGGKKIPTVTFKVAAISYNGQSWSAGNNDKVFVDITSNGAVDKQSAELSISGSGTVTFTNLVPNATYTITNSLEEVTSSGYVKRDVGGVLGYFTSPDGDAPADTTLFSLPQKPEVSEITQDGKKIQIVKLNILSKVDENISVVISPVPQGGLTSQYVVFKKNQTTPVTFPSLLASTQYSVMVARYIPNISGGDGKYEQVAALGTFYTLTSTGTPATPITTPSGPAISTPANPSTTSGLPRGTADGPRANINTTCTDGIDNDKDGRADYYGTTDMEPDPACFNASADEVADDVAAGSLVPCTNKCGFRDVFVLLNNVLKFVISKLLIPLFVIMIMFIGYQYLMAQGKPGMHAKLKKMLWHMVIGLVLILGAWLIVRTLLSAIGYTDGLQFFD